MRIRIPTAVALATTFALAGCTPRPKVDPGMPTPPPGTTWPVIKNESGSLTTSGGVTTYVDRVAKFQLELPPDFTGKLSFTADPAGPPVRGAVKLRMTDAETLPCVIDVATEPAKSAEALAATIAAGREVFYLAETGEPLPSLPVSEVWTATLIPATADRVDLGYWLFTPEQLLRVEGRFPVARLGSCKEALDGVVRSIAPSGDGAAASR